MKTVYIEPDKMPDVSFTVYQPHADGTDVEELMVGFYPLFTDVEFKGEPQVLLAYFRMLVARLALVGMISRDMPPPSLPGLDLSLYKTGEKTVYEWRDVAKKWQDVSFT